MNNAEDIRNLVVEVLNNLGSDKNQPWLQGSGFFVGKNLVLTAFHNVQGASELFVRCILRGAEKFPAKVLLQGDKNIDLALLEVSNMEVDAPRLHYGKVDQSVSALVGQCWAIGFPKFKERMYENKPLRDSAQVDGEIPTADYLKSASLKQPLLALRVKNSPRPLPSGPIPKSEWAGISGAAVLSGGDIIVGVITEHHLSEGESTLAAVPITALDLLPQDEATKWWKLLGANPQALVRLPGETVARTKYLEGMLRRYSSVTLPIGPISLNAIFQPLALCHDPLAAELLEQRERRALLGEPVPDDGSSPSPPIVAENGDDALQKTPGGRLVVLGGPGSGKTTVLKYLVGDRAQQALTASTSAIPIFISLPDFARLSKPLPRYLVDLVGDMGVEDRYADLLWQEIEAGNAFICMDGLDEVEPLHRPHIIALLNDWGSRAGNTWIIGSRFTEYKGGQFTQAQFAEWELMPLNHPLRLQLAQRLLPELQRLLSVSHNTSPPTAETFVDTLEQHSQAAARGENPLLFSLAAVVFMQTGNLPSSRTMLYREVSDAVLESREQDTARRELLRSVIAQVALEMYQWRGRTFTLRELNELLPQVRTSQRETWETTAMAKQIISSGILEVVAKQTYSFRHQTFQEYLAAADLVRRLTSRDAPTRDEAWELVWSKRTYSRWSEVLRLMFGELVLSGTAGRDMALRWLHALLKQREAEDGDPGNLALELALTSLIEVVGMPEWRSPKTIKLDEHVVSTWLQAMLDSPTQIHIETVSQELSHLPEPLAQLVIERSLAALINQDEGKLHTVTEILKRQGPRVPLKPLLDALENGGTQTRSAALQILAVKGERVPLEPLLAALFKGDWSAQEALVAQRERVPVEPLIQAFQEKGSSAVGHVLVELGERVPFEPFLPYLLENKDLHWDASYEVVACRVVISQKERLPLELWLDILRNLSPVSTNMRLLEEHIPVPVEALFDLLEDDNEFTRWVAARLLGKRVAAQQLLHLTQFWDTRVRKIILDALYMHLSVASLLEALHPLSYSACMSFLGLDDSHPEIRGAAMAALGKDLPQDMLLAGLHDEHEAIRQGAIKAIAAQGKEADIMLLAPALQDHSSLVRSEAVKTLGILGGKGVAVPSAWLLTALHDTDDFVESQAEAAFGAIGEHLPLEVLILTLQDGNGQVERYAYTMLQAMTSQIPGATLLEQIQKNCADLRCAALYILGVQGKQCPVDLLLASLHDTCTPVRRAAVEVLGIQQRRLLGEALLTALHDEDGGVRNATAQALQLLGKHAPVEGVLIALNDHDYKIRRIAAEMCKIQELHVPVEAMITALKSVDSVVTFTADRVSVRILVIEALALREEEQVEDALSYALYYDRDPPVRHAAAQALYRRWGPLPEEVLDNILKDLQDEDVYPRRAAVEILGVYGEQAEAVPIEVFLNVLEEEQEAEVWLAAFNVLLAQAARIPAEVIEDMLQWGDPGVFARTERVVQVLKAFVAKGTSAPLSLLQDALRSLQSWDEESAATIAQSLEIQGAQLPVEVLLQALRSRSQEVRQGAVQVLKTHKKQVPVELLRAHIQDEDVQFQSSILEILAVYGEPLPAELLMTALYKTASSESRKRIVRALIAQGERIPLALLLPKLYATSPNIRHSALVVLRALKKPVPLEMLLLLLCDEDMKVIRIAAFMLYEMYPDVMNSIFAEAATIVQGQTSVTFLASIAQSFLATVIGEIGHPAPEFLDKLTELLRWPHWQVRLNAIRALQKLRRNIPDEAIRLLLQLRRDPDPPLEVIRNAADYALAELLSLEAGIEDDVL